MLTVATPPAASRDTPPLILPADCADVRELRGDLSIARVRSGTEGELVQWLDSQGYGFYSPRERVVREYKIAGTERYRRKSWYRGVIPGMVIVADGYEGRSAATEYGRKWSNTVYGWIGFQGSGATGERLREELYRLQCHLAQDPSLKRLSGLAVGTRCRVTTGKFEGYEGTIIADGEDELFRVNLKYAFTAELNIEARFLEPIY